MHTENSFYLQRIGYVISFWNFYIIGVEKITEYILNIFTKSVHKNAFCTHTHPNLNIVTKVCVHMISQLTGFTVSSNLLLHMTGI
jgi:hypothetical protein